MDSSLVKKSIGLDEEELAVWRGFLISPLKIEVTDFSGGPVVENLPC